MAAEQQLAEFGHFSFVSKIMIITGTARVGVRVSILVDRNLLAVCYCEHRYTNDILNDTTVRLKRGTFRFGTLLTIRRYGVFAGN